MPNTLTTAPGTGHNAVILDDHRIEEALAGLYRSVSACQFYPPNHPILGEAQEAGYQAWGRVAEDFRWEQPGLLLRSGGLWFGETRLGAENPSVASLVRVLAGHGLVGLRRTGTLTQDGFNWLISTLATAPDVVASRGGIRSAWQREAFAKSLALEALAVVAGDGSGTVGGGDKRRKERREQWGQGVEESAEGLAGTDNFLLGRLRSLQQRSPREQLLVDQLLRLGRAEDIQAFLASLREITGFVEGYLEVERYREAFYVVLFLYREAQNMEALGEGGQRDYLLDTIRMVVKGAFLGWLIQHVASAQGEEEAEVGEFILRALGKAAVVPVINALCGANSRVMRRRLVNVLVSIGGPAVPWAIRMLDDQRWFVVRNMVTVLGGVGSAEAMKALLRLTGDPDARIRKEVARALGRSPATWVEEPLLVLLEDCDPGVQQMAVSASATHGSPRVLDGVWRAYQRVPIGGAHWELKVVALHAVARMGLEEAEGRLLRELQRRHWFSRERWRKVRVAAAQALGKVGGAAAVGALERCRQRSEPEQRAAAERALAVLERRIGSGS